MLRKESEAVPDGNGPVHQEDEFGSGQPTLVDPFQRLEDISDKRIDVITRLLEQHLESQEQDARQPRRAMEADGPANTKTCERTEGAATAVQAMHGDSFSDCRVDLCPMTNSTNFGIKAEPPALPCRDGVVVESGDAAPKSCLPSLEMRSPSAAGGVLPAGDTSTATRTTFNKLPFRLYAIEKTNSKEKNLRTSVLSAWNSSFWKLLAVPSCRRVIETKSGQIGRSIQAVLKVVSAPASYWERGARCFAARLCVWERLVTSCSVFRRRFTGSFKQGRL